MLPSRNTIPESAIGIDNNEQSDYFTCIQRKNRHSRLEGPKIVVQSLMIGFRNTFEYSCLKRLYNKPNFTSKNGHKIH